MGNTKRHTQSENKKIHTHALARSDDRSILEKKKKSSGRGKGGWGGVLKKKKSNHPCNSISPSLLQRLSLHTKPKLKNLETHTTAPMGDERVPKPCVTAAAAKRAIVIGTQERLPQSASRSRRQPSQGPAGERGKNVKVDR